MSNSPEEYKVLKPLERHFNEKFRHGNNQETDWIGKRTGLSVEVKGINYPLTHFSKSIRVNAVSISRHARENPNSIVALVFSDGAILTANPESIVANSQVEPSQYAGDRETYLTPLSVFQPL